MQSVQPVIAFTAVLTSVARAETTANPISKVISMIEGLQAKVIREGEASHKEFAEFSEWCEDRNRNLDFEIKTGKSETEDLKAAIGNEAATITALTAKVEELAASLSTNEADHKAATEIRAKEAADFKAEEKELMETTDILTRAIQILEREMKSGASMLQLQNAKTLAQALSALVQASVIGTSDAAKLTAFVQDTQKSDDSDGDEELGAPEAAAYKSRSSGIIDTMEDLLEKAQAQLDECRKKETDAKHNYELLAQSLEDEIKVSNKDMDEAKKGIAGSTERKSTAEGDLQVTSKDLASDEDTKETLHHDCMSRSSDYEEEVKSRGEELKVLADAKKIIQESVGGASSASSFLQLFGHSSNAIASGEDLANFEAVRLVRDLARKQNSPLLAQLARRMAAVIRSGAGDPFQKVKGLITDMIAKLEKEAGADATKKAYCDKELKETSQKKLDKTTNVEMLSTRIDQMSAKSESLKAAVSTLQNELAELAGSQAEMDKLRKEEHDLFTANKAEQEKGLEGVKMALKVLREYYAKSDSAAHDASSGAAGGIIGLLETVESDMTKTLAELMTNEDTAQRSYDSMTQKNEIEKATKEQDVKYKTKEFKGLDKSVTEAKEDRTNVQAELDAVLEYLAKIEEQCIAKPEAYEERVRRREAEIAGLKEALEILKSESSFLQRIKKPSQLRGVSRH